MFEYNDLVMVVNLPEKCELQGKLAFVTGVANYFPNILKVDGTYTDGNHYIISFPKVMSNGFYSTTMPAVCLEFVDRV